MSKIITSPVKRFPGTVTLADPLTFPQYLAWQRALNSAQAHRDDNAEFVGTLLPGLFACVESWSLTGFPESVTPATFPATPRISSDRIVGWLIREIGALIREADEADPK